MTQLDNRMGYHSERSVDHRIGFANGVEIRRGDERLEKRQSAVSTEKAWFCPVHGHVHAVKVLAAGEVYPACRWCISNSNLIKIGELEASL